jgi:FdhD protein
MHRSLTGLTQRGGETRALTAALAEEVAVALVHDGTTTAVMMATPADLEDFSLGFALSERIIASPSQVESLERIDGAEGIEMRMWLAAAPGQALAARRRSMAGPVGCGLCGIDSLAEALRPLPEVGGQALRLTARGVTEAALALRAGQPLHDRTRAAHAAGFWVPGQGMVTTREDVGRHNALDKLIGALARAGIDPATGAAVMTSRVSVDLIQKCAVAGLPVLIAASAPTAQAVDLAAGAGMTLVARTRPEGFDCYAGAFRLVPGEVPHVA